MARVLGIDHGSRRFGLALSDPVGSIAWPLKVVEGEAALWEYLAGLLREKDIERVVLGLPLNMNGTLGPKAKQVIEFKDRLATRLGKPVELWDERLTTVEAEELLREGGVPLHKRRQLVDKVAAQILLQSFLDSRKLNG